MGTNYYWHEPECKECGRGEVIHVGKSSVGWCFALHVDSALDLNSLDDWRERWKTGHIQDEYGDRVSVAEMEDRITNRKWPGTPRGSNAGYPQHESGCIRRPVNDRSGCIGWGEGTWDLMPGEFS